MKIQLGATMNDTTLLIWLSLISIVMSIIESRQDLSAKTRIINKSDLKRPLEIIPAQSGEVVNEVYEDEREFHDSMEEAEPHSHYPHSPPVPLIPLADSSLGLGLGALSKRQYGHHHYFGEDFALFLVLLTIAGFFGLIISMLMPFTFILANGGMLPLGVGGINGLGLGGGLGGGIGGLGGLGGIGLGGLGRKRRSHMETYLTQKIVDLIASLESALEKYRILEAKN